MCDGPTPRFSAFFAAWRVEALSSVVSRSDGFYTLWSFWHAVLLCMNHHLALGKILSVIVGAHTSLYLAFSPRLCDFDAANLYEYREPSQQMISSSHVLRRSWQEMQHASQYYPCLWIGRRGGLVFTIGTLDLQVERKMLLRTKLRGNGILLSYKKLLTTSTTQSYMNAFDESLRRLFGLL